MWTTAEVLIVAVLSAAAGGVVAAGVAVWLNGPAEAEAYHKGFLSGRDHGRELHRSAGFADGLAEGVAQGLRDAQAAEHARRSGAAKRAAATRLTKRGSGDVVGT